MRPQGVTTVNATRVLAALWRGAQQPDMALDAIKLTGAEPILRSSFAVGTAAQTTIAAAALAAGEPWRLRTGQRQRISVDVRDAAVEFRSKYHLRVNGVPAHDGGDGIAGLYRCADGRWARHSLVQTASGGLNAAQGRSGWRRHALPAQALDHGTGYLMALAARTALARRVEQGGSWYVRTSPAQTGYCIRQLGRIDGMACPDADDVNDRLETQASGFGGLTAIRPAAIMTDTPPHWVRPSVPPGTHAPVWPE